MLRTCPYFLSECAERFEVNKYVVLTKSFPYCSLNVFMYVVQELTLFSVPISINAERKRVFR